MEVKPEVKPEVVKEKRKPGAQPGRVMTDAQREGLKKGFEALKAKREAIKAEKEAKKASLTKPDELPTSNQTVTNPPANTTQFSPEKVPPPLKKPRNRIPAVNKNDFEAFKTDLYSRLGQQPQKLPKVEEVKAEVKAEEVKAEVEKATVKPQPQQPQVLSGSALLNKIFFNK
jgi:hypothetical protein